VLAGLPRVRQAVILGAGLDSRARRLPPMRQVTVFEVDHPAMQAAKRRVVQRGAAERAGHVRFVPVVFGTDDPAGKLTESGFVPGEPTLVLWEGVTNYLAPEAVDATFRFLTAAVGPGSPVLADRGFALEWDTTVSDAAERLYPAGTCPSVPAYYHVAGARRC